MSAVDIRSAEDVIDTVRYPLSAPESAAWHDMVRRVRQDLDRSGCSVLPDFVRPALHDQLRAEGASVAPHAYYDVEVVNAYNISTDRPLPANHPGRITMERGNAFVARDQIPGDLIISRLYTNRLFQKFVASCFRLPTIYELADPLSALCLNVVTPGTGHPWHFDTNEFTVSMLTQAPQDGGTFEYCPNIRSGREENFEGVRGVLAGDRDDLIRRLALRPGDLQLFTGRYSLHRVSPVHGNQARHSAIFAYSQREGVVGSVARTRQLFGRVLPEHLAADGHATRGDQLLD